MNKIKCLLLLYLAFLPFYSHGQKMLIRLTTGEKTGKLLELRGYAHIADYIFGRKVLLTSQPDKAGRYEFRLAWPEGAPVSLGYTGEADLIPEFYLRPDDSLEITFKGSDTSVKGAGSGSLQYALKKNTLRSVVIETRSSGLPDITWEAWQKQQESVRKTSASLLVQSARELSLSGEAQNYYGYQILYMWAEGLLQYPLWKPRFYNDYKEDVKAISELNTLLQQAPLYNPDAVRTPAYHQYLNAYTRYLWHWQNRYRSEKEPIAGLYAQVRSRLHTADSLKQPSVRSYAYGGLIKDLIQDSQFDDHGLLRMHLADSLLARLSTFAVPEFYAGIKAMAAESMHKMEIPAPAFTLKDSKGKAVSLSQYKGKVVLMDFWGTWCKPCIEAIPASNALQAEYIGKDLVVLTICIRCEEAAWRKLPAEKSWNGVHLYSTSADNINLKYYVEGFPSYILIDRQGNVADLQAPEPGTPELKEKIDRLLKQN